VEYFIYVSHVERHRNWNVGMSKRRGRSIFNLQLDCQLGLGRNINFLFKEISAISSIEELWSKLLESNGILWKIRSIRMCEYNTSVYCYGNSVCWTKERMKNDKDKLDVSGIDFSMYSILFLSIHRFFFVFFFCYLRGLPEWCKKGVSVRAGKSSVSPIIT
jgi:hypothetical protein